MSKWRAHGSIIRDEDGTQIAEAGSKEIAQQIVREHNAHGELVEIATARREERVLMRSMTGGYLELRRKYQADIEKIDAVLARAEGRENEHAKT